MRGEFVGFFIIKQLKKPRLCSVDCSQPLYERVRKKSRASAKHAGGGGGGGVCEPLHFA